MADADGRATLREAERTGLGSAWARAALELARVGLHEEAGRAAWSALLEGGDPSEGLDALAIELEALEVTTLGVAGELPPMSLPVWSHDGGAVYVAAGLRRLVRWDLCEERATGVWEAPAPITAIAVAPGGESVVVATANKRSAALDVVDVRAGSARRLEVDKNAQTLAVGRDRVLAASLGASGVRALAREAAPGAAPLWQVEGSHARLDRWGGFVIDVPRQPGVQRLHDRHGALVRQLSAAGSQERAVLAGRRVLAFDGAGQFVLADLHGAELLRCDGGPVSSHGFAPAPHGRQVAFSGLDRETVVLFDLRDRRRRELTTGFHWALAWSPTGRSLAVPTKDGRLALIRAPG